MWRSLGKLMALPDATRVYCGHEYTLSNARFALGLEPDNPALRQRAAAIEATRAKGEPTIPTTIGVEKATSPFLRAADPALRRRSGWRAPPTPRCSPRSAAARTAPEPAQAASGAVSCR